MTDTEKKQEVEYKIAPVGEALGVLAVPGSELSPVVVIGTEAIRNSFDSVCLQQSINCRLAPGVSNVILNPDGHAGFGAPVGSVLVSPTHIYPGPVGVDIKCSMSLLSLELPADVISERTIRRELINAICSRIPTGTGRGQRDAPKARHVSLEVAKQAVIEGASPAVCRAIGVPESWIASCEESAHFGHDETRSSLEARLDSLLGTRRLAKFPEKMAQLGSYGGGNHFGECAAVQLEQSARAETVGGAFGLREGMVVFLSHCGSRGFGHALASAQFKKLQAKFIEEDIPFPGGDRELIYAPLGSPEANEYRDDMSLGGNFATVNHLLINALVLEAFQEVFPGTTGKLVYFISHNFARQEVVGSQLCWVHRKGATRAFPAGHPELRGTPFEKIGHPILLPGNPRDGSMVMVAESGAHRSCYTINHGAGRTMGRRAAIRALDQDAVDAELRANDILTNCRHYPRDESPAAYKDFREVLRSVEKAGLATPIASLKTRFVIKDGEPSLR